ncbi:MAG TPA: hypothetical protein VI699_06795 [Candidatus Acidoferrales bacterium]|nr:hypothetical protein [Candidatus Acidoferrales bacterium]
MLPARTPNSDLSRTSTSVSKAGHSATDPRADKARKWMWMLLAAIAAVQIYFVQELLAALLLFTLGFAVLGALAVAVFGLEKASRWTLAMWRRVRVAVLALAEDLSRKLHRRPRSEPAR